MAVLRRKISRQYVAWLAMLAMALIVVMPSVCRVMLVADAMPMPGMNADCAQLMHGARHPGKPDSPTDPTAKCGYCILFDHLPMLTTIAQVPMYQALPAQATPALVRIDNAYAQPLLSARPRGPPRNV